ncbi:type III secretion system gatekeeper subunit SctW [Shewanella sp. VB17]|uniref:type III secretion system gatekeeper subunit SctW n=1 Tax=Shewanella sp. VB17 TaxID=2739432 RepID=UPI0015647645|nr:type III secretion system gatekeeper subunit SctW [Shewanella sp. VB17]NRD71755.1 type III secretion system gatekeeper subunit SctW [Shewanella sp. VB17]
MADNNIGPQSVVNARSLFAQTAVTNLAEKSVINGNYRGDVVKLQPDAKALLDAAEELTFKASETEGLNISKRKVQDVNGAVSEIQALVEEYLKKVPELEKQQKLNDFISHLTKQNISVSQQFLTYLNSYSADVSDQFVALSEAKKQLTGKPEAEALLRLIDASLTQMAEKQGAEVRAGLIIYETAVEFSSNKDIGDIQGLRNFYRDAVLDYHGLADAFNDIFTRFGTKNMPNAISFLLKGLSADLQVQGSSIESSKLQQLMGDMNKLRIINGMHEQVVTLFDRVKIPIIA